MSRVSDVLKFNDKGPSVEEARRKMIEAGEAPSGKHIPLPAEAVDALDPEFVDNGAVVTAKNPNKEAQEAEAVRLATQSETPLAPPNQPARVEAIVEDKDEKVERIENDRFVAEIKQEKGKWVAELQYKSGSGTERFVANSKNELMLKLLEGKGHATLRVKEAVRREKLGGPKLDKAYSLPEGMTSEEFSKMTPVAQSAVIEAIAMANAMTFREAHPEYYKTKANGEALDKFLKEHDLPYTVTNLEYAFEDMIENDLFPDKREPVRTMEPAAPSSTSQRVAPKAEDSAPATLPAAPASADAPPATPPATVTRKRGSTGLPGGHSSVPSDGTAGAEDASTTKKEPSEAELRKLPLTELKRIADADRRSRAQVR